jgi:PAS domain S-box-containing protein
VKPKYYVPWLFLVGAAYFATGKLGLSLASVHVNVSPVWPPTGLAIAAIWLLGFEIWPAIAVGAFLLNVFTGVSIPTAAGISVGNTLEAVCAGFLLHRLVASRNPLFRAGDVLRFILAASATTAISATIGNISLVLGGAASWSDFGTLWLTWWLGDGVGALVVTPLLLTWQEPAPSRLSVRQLTEALLMIVSVAIVSDIVFGGLFFPEITRFPLEYLTMPFLLWAAFAFGPRGGATAIAVLSFVATWGTTRGLGPFAAHNENESLLLLQLFVASAAITTLVLAAIVTERKKTEEDLRAKENQLQLITGITPIALAQCSSDLQYRFVNPAYADIFGLAPEQIVGKSMPEFIGDQAYETVRPQVERVLEGSRVDYESAIPYERAATRFMRVACMPDRDNRGKVVGWVASLTDITDLKSIEDQIKKLNSELQRRIVEFTALIDTAPIGIGVALNPQCTEIWGNPEFIKMLGTDESNLSMTGPTKDKLRFRVLRNGHEVPPEDLPMQKACREGRTVLNDELEVVRSDGRVIHELCRATPLLDEQGRVRGCIGVFLNVTDQKQAEREREQLLARERDARAEAETASRVKDEFLAVISHELRTPLNSILGWAQLLRGGRLDTATSARAMESIERNAKAQAKLVDDLLDVSRIISGKLHLEVKQIELIRVINAAVDSLRHAIDSKEIQLETVMDASASRIQGDPTRLQQVIWNLLSNAAKFTAKGGRIEIRLERKGDSTQFSISDNGKGIRPDFLPYVFDRFRQEDSSRTRRHGGLGLGLAIVHNLVELHGGIVEVYSAGEGSGATFRVTLPVGKLVGEFSKRDQHLRLSPTGQILAGVRLLIVEDDPDSAEMLRMVVNLHGAEVKTAAKTSDALHILEQWQPEVLIADIGLPDEDGYGLIKKATAIAREKNWQMHSIALTGYAGEQEGLRALNSGFHLYLAKPTEPRRLVDAISSLLSHENTAVP